MQQEEDRSAKTGTLVVERTSDRDIKMRDLYVFVDDMPEQNVMFGNTLEIPLDPGEHRLKITNRLFSDQATFTVREGETVRFSATNVLKNGLLNVVAAVGGGVMYKPILKRT